MALPATSRLALLGGVCVSQFFFFLARGMACLWSGMAWSCGKQNAVKRSRLSSENSRGLPQVGQDRAEL